MEIELNIFKIVYWIGLLIEVVVRTPYQRMAKAGKKIEKRGSVTENILLLTLVVVMFFLPLIYSITNWLDFANYNLPTWMAWLGVILLACSLFIFWRSHFDLKANWSPTLEIRADHALITSGIYKVIRHPMYASQWLWVLAQILLLQNWLAGPVDLVFFIVFYFFRVRAEEKMMLDTFGEKYAEYIRNTGGVIPRMGILH